MNDKLHLTILKYGETTLPEKWIFAGCESTGSLPISLLFYLIRIGDRVILADVGCDIMYGFDTPLFEKPVKILEDYGVPADSVTDVIISHSHHDHIDAVRYYKNANIYIQSEEAKFGAKYLPTDGRVITYDDELTLFGRLHIICIGGHSVGSSVIEFEEDGKKYVMVGDEAYSELCFTRCVGAGSPYNPEKNFEFIRTRSSSEYHRLVYHDPNVLPGKLGAMELI